MSSEWRRLHWSSFFFGLGPVARTALPLLVLLILARDLGWQKWLLVPLVPSAIGALVRLFTQVYRFGESAFVLQHGILSRNVREIPYARIQHVELTQGPLQRLLGVAVVTIQSGGNAEQPEAALRVLSLAAAEDLRARIDAARGRSEGAAEAPPTVLVRLTPRDLVFAGLAEGRGFIVVGGVLGLLWQGADLLGIPVPFGSENFGREEFRRGMKLATSVVPSIGIFALEVLAVIVLFRLLSITWAAVKLYGFTLTRDGDILRSRYGLVTRYAAAIPRHRVQMLTIIETPLLRLAGRAAVKVQTAARFQAEQGRVGAEWLAPVLRRDRVRALVEEVLPGADPDALPWSPVHRDAWKREWRGGLLVTAGATLALAWPFGWWALAATVVGGLWAWFSARGLAKRYAYAVTGDAIAFRSGWINHRLSVVRLARVQSVKLGESFLDRRWGMATVAVDTAGSSGAAHKVEIPYVPREIAGDLFAWVRKGDSPLYPPDTTKPVATGE
jgi:putative membrane protein